VMQVVPCYGIYFVHTLIPLIFVPLNFCAPNFCTPLKR